MRSDHRHRPRHHTPSRYHAPHPTNALNRTDLDVNRPRHGIAAVLPYTAMDAIIIIIIISSSSSSLPLSPSLSLEPTSLVLRAMGHIPSRRIDT